MSSKYGRATQQKLDEINKDIFQSNLLNKFDTLNTIMSAFLFIAIKDSTLKTMTANEIEKISPVVNSIAKSINKNINVWIAFIFRNNSHYFGGYSFCYISI